MKVEKHDDFSMNGGWESVLGLGSPLRRIPSNHEFKKYAPARGPGVGRDYADISPVSGTCSGAATQSLQVEVTVSPLAAQAS